MRWAVILSAAGLLAAPAAAHPLDRHLPRDTLFYLSLDDLGRTAARWSGGRWHRHWSDPRMQEVWTAVQGWIERSRAGGPAPWTADLLDPAGGQVVLAVVPGPGGPAGVVLVEAAGPPPSPPGAAVLPGDGWFAAAADARTFQALPRPGDATLADDPALRRVRAATGPGADVTLWAPPPALAEVAAWRPSLGRLLTVLGGRAGIRGLGGGMTLEEDALVTRLFLLAPRKRGMLRVLDVPNAPIPPPALAPRNATGFTTAHLDLRALGPGLRDVAPHVDFEAMIEGVGGQVALRFLRGFGHEFTTVRVRGGEVLVAEVRSARVRREMAAFAGAVSRTVDEGGRPIHVGPDGSALAFIGDRLVAGARQEDVRAMLRGDAGGLAGDPELREALARLPPERILLWFKRGPDRSDGAPGFWRGQACALVNEHDGLVLTHVLLAR